MKLDKSTKVLMNLVLILAIALLLKLLITIPRDVYAQSGNEYKVSSIEEEFKMLVKEVGKRKLGTEWWEKMAPYEKVTYMFNFNSDNGWRFHSFIIFEEEVLLIFER